MVRPILIDINPAELKYYPFIISLNKSTGSSNVLSLKICVPKKKQKTYMANRIITHINVNVKIIENEERL